MAAAENKAGAGVQRKMQKKVANAVAKLKLSKDKKKMNMEKLAAVVERATTRSRATTSSKAPAPSTQKLKKAAEKAKLA